jgi:electron transfer flavoprotein alpha subunit
MLNTNFELISEGRKLADERGSKLVGVILGEDVSDLAHELGGYGADKVIVCNHTNLKEYTTDAYANINRCF